MTRFCLLRDMIINTVYMSESNQANIYRGSAIAIIILCPNEISELSTSKQTESNMKRPLKRTAYAHWLLTASITPSPSFSLQTMIG